MPLLRWYAPTIISANPGSKGQRGIRSCINNEFIIWFSHAFVSSRFNIPQKLSNSTLSLPCIQRTSTSTLPFSLDFSWTLKPNVGSLLSLSLSEATLLVESCLTCCILRRAARLHTFPFANPRPVAKIGRYRNFTPKEIKVSLIDRAQESTLLSLTVNMLSEGKGSKCLGSVDVPRATFFEDLSQLIKVKASVLKFDKPGLASYSPSSKQHSIASFCCLESNL